MSCLTLAVFAVEKIADGAAASRIDFVLGPWVGVIGGAASSSFGIILRFAARRAAVGEAGLPGAKFKFFTADDTNFDRKSHASMVANLDAASQ